MLFYVLILLVCYPGLAETDYESGNSSSKAAAVAMARKRSRAAATQNAFAKVTQ